MYWRCQEVLDQVPVVDHGLAQILGLGPFGGAGLASVPALSQGPRVLGEQIGELGFVAADGVAALAHDSDHEPGRSAG
jgi:hypothetical protein